MAIPIHKHQYRSHKIEFKLFPKNRTNVFDNTLFKKEYQNVLNVFMFWIFLVFVGRFSMVFLVMLNPRPYTGLAVALPEAGVNRSLSPSRADINIFIDKEFSIIVNDNRIKTLNELSPFFEEHKLGNKNFNVFLYVDLSCKMGNLQTIFKSLRKAGLLNVNFRTR